MRKTKYDGYREYACTREYSHPLYDAWRNMKRRCYYKNSKTYKNYGGRGISVCDEWRNDYTAFLKWALTNGWKEHLQLDRIDNNGNYKPNNCRWVTQQENLLNTRHNRNVAYNGKCQTVTEWAKELGMNVRTLTKRLNKWSVEDAFTKPINTAYRRVHNF